MPTIEAGLFSAAGGPQLRLGLGFFLVGSPDLLAGLRLLRRNALHLGCDAVERAGEAYGLALRFVGAGLLRLLDHDLGILEAIPEGRVDLLVGNLDFEL